MANGYGMLGSLPPGLRGVLAAEQMGQQRSQNQLGQIGGILGLQNAMTEQQMTPLKIEQLQIAIANARQNQQMRQGLLGGVGATSAAPTAFGEGGMSTPGGGQANMQTGQTIPPQQGGASGGMSPQIMSMLLSGDPGLTATAKAMLEQNKPIATREGGGIYSPGTGWILPPQPKTQPGINYDPQSRSASPVAGYGPAIASIEGAVTRAQEAARAPYQRPIETIGPNGEKIQTPVPVFAAPYLNTQGRPSQPGFQVPPQVQAGRDAEAQRIRTAELQPGGGGMIPSARVLPGVSVGPTPAATATAEVTARERAESGVKFETSILDGGQKARTNLTQLQILAPNLDKLPTGPLYPTLVNAGAYLQQFGINVGQLSKDLGPAQATDAILKKLAIAGRDTSGGGGMPGAMSDADRKFLVDSIPGLNKLPDGNRRLLDMMMKLEQRKVDEAAIVQKMQADGKGSGEIRSALGQFAGARPMFTQ